MGYGLGVESLAENSLAIESLEGWSLGGRTVRKEPLKVGTEGAERPEGVETQRW